MSTRCQNFSNLLHSSLLVAGLWLLALVGTVALPNAAEATDLEPFFEQCASIVPLNSTATWRDQGDIAGRVHCFSILIETPGLVASEVLVAAGDSRIRLDAQFEPFALSDATKVDEDVASELFRHSPTDLVAALQPGEVLLRVRAEDPRSDLPPFRLQVQFAEGVMGPKSETDSELEAEPNPFADKSETDSELEAEPNPFADKSETDSELEAEPNPFVAQLGQCARKSETDSELEAEPNPFADKSETDSELEAEPNPFADKSETDSELEAEPNPLMAGPVEGLQGICRQALGADRDNDDHGDGFFCATALAPSCQGASLVAEGDIDNGWGDDEDTFRFELATLTTLEMLAKADFEIEMELYDARGQRLDVVIDGKDSARLIRTLVPGTYFLRLGGRHGMTGQYSLQVGELAF